MSVDLPCKTETVWSCRRSASVCVSVCMCVCVCVCVCVLKKQKNCATVIFYFVSNRLYFHVFTFYVESFTDFQV